MSIARTTYDRPSNAFIVDIRRHSRWKGARPASPPQDWRLGLLAKTPDADRAGYRELEIEGYKRIALALGPRNEASKTVLSNVDLLTFGPVTTKWPKTVWAAVFDSRGDLFGYRYLQPWGSSTFTGLINIRPFDLTISF
jgi:hypothetical protein